MTLVELTVTLAAIAIVMTSLVLVNRTLRHDVAEDETRHTLQVLQAALRLYEDEHDRLPAGDVSDVLTSLHNHPPAADQLANLRHHRTPTGQPLVLDGFGRPIQYHAGDNQRKLPPSFVSAGASGRFGYENPQPTDVRSAAADNLYGFELEATPR